MDRDVAVAKIATIRRCLDRIAAQTEATEGRLDTLDSQDIVAMNVQRAAQAAIDLAATWCAGLGLAPSQTLKGHFEALGKTGVLDATRVRRLSAMVGFRNVAVHEYEEIDADILRAIATHDVVDLAAFADLAAAALVASGA